MPNPKILTPRGQLEHRVLKVPSFEVDLRQNGELLDPGVLDRLEIVLEVAVERGYVDWGIKPLSLEGSSSARFQAGTQRLVVKSQIVPGSPNVTAYQQAPEQLTFGSQEREAS